MSVNFTIDQKELTAFEQYMTHAMQAEVEAAYSRALNRIGRGCVAFIKKRLGNSVDSKDRALLGSGIAYAPVTAKRISELNPPRIIIGAGSSRKRHFLKQTLVGRPFRVTLTTKKGKYDVMAQRNTRTKHVDRETALSPRRISGTNITYQSHQSFNGYRNTALPITVVSAIKLDSTQELRFRGLVKEYLVANHDKIVTQELNNAEKRASKRRSKR